MRVMKMKVNTWPVQCEIIAFIAPDWGVPIYRVVRGRFTMSESPLTAHQSK
jgi:hypothetical protein